MPMMPAHPNHLIAHSQINQFGPYPTGLVHAGGSFMGTSTGVGSNDTLPATASSNSAFELASMPAPAPAVTSLGPSESLFLGFAHKTEKYYSQEAFLGRALADLNQYGIDRLATSKSVSAKKTNKYTPDHTLFPYERAYYCCGTCSARERETSNNEIGCCGLSFSVSLGEEAGVIAMVTCVHCYSFINSRHLSHITFM